MNSPRLPDPVAPAPAPIRPSSPALPGSTPGSRGGATPGLGMFRVPMFTSLAASRQGGRKSLLGGG